MTRTCRLVRPGLDAPAEWSFDGQSLLLVPEGRAAEAYAVRELSAVSGDDYSVTVRSGDWDVTLGRLGGDASTLLDALQRAWLPARADALRLDAGGESRRFAGTVLAPGDPTRFRALLLPHALLLAPEGRDIEPVFLALLESIALDEYTIRCHPWSGPELVLGRLGGQTAEFADALRAARGALARDAAERLARHLPTLDAAARATLASAWPAARLVGLLHLDRLVPGVRQALLASWLPALARRREGEALLEWARDGEVLLGWTGPTDASAGSEPEPDHDVDESAEADDAPAPAAEDARLWLLAGRAGEWLLESVTEGDRATYRFRAGEELPELASKLLSAPQFSREALYLPLERLVSERAHLAIAARDLAFLRDLRERFAGRLIHSSFDRWRAGLPS